MDDQLPLRGLRVADFSWYAAGPIAARTLASFGAEVVRVESEAHLDGLRTRRELAPRPTMFAKFHGNSRTKAAPLLSWRPTPSPIPCKRQAWRVRSKSRTGAPTFPPCGPPCDTTLRDWQKGPARTRQDPPIDRHWSLQDQGTASFRWVRKRFPAENQSPSPKTGFPRAEATGFGEQDCGCLAGYDRHRRDHPIEQFPPSQPCERPLSLQRPPWDPAQGRYDDVFPSAAGAPRTPYQLVH